MVRTNSFGGTESSLTAARCSISLTDCLHWCCLFCWCFVPWNPHSWFAHDSAKRYCSAVYPMLYSLPPSPCCLCQALVDTAACARTASSSSPCHRSKFGTAPPISCFLVSGSISGVDPCFATPSCCRWFAWTDKYLESSIHYNYHT